MIDISETPAHNFSCFVIVLHLEGKLVLLLFLVVAKMVLCDVT